MSAVFQCIGLDDIYGTTAGVVVHDRQDDPPIQKPTIQLRVEVGQCGGIGFPTPTAARQLAAALVEAADLVEKLAGDDEAVA